MPRITFTATPGLPDLKGGRIWRHRNGGRSYDEKGAYRLVEPIDWITGETIEVTPKEAEWLLNNAPQCFKLAKHDSTEET